MDESEQSNDTSLVEFDNLEAGRPDDDDDEAKLLEESTSGDTLEKSNNSNKCRQLFGCTTLGKACVSLLFVACFVYFITFIVILPLAHVDQSPDPHVVEPYTKLAEDVLADMDQSINPCDNFYQYSCGTWIERTELDTSKYRQSRSFDTVYDRNKDIIKEKIEQNWPILTELYNSCIDTETIELSESDVIIKNLSDSIMASSNIQELMSIIRSVHMNEGIDINPFFGMYVDIDSMEPSSYLLTLSQRGFLLPEKSYYSKDNGFINQTEYSEWIQDMYNVLGFYLSGNESQLLIDLEYSLANISISSTDSRNPYLTYNKISIDTLEIELGVTIANFINGWNFNASYVNAAHLSYLTQLGEFLDNETFDINVLKNITVLNLMAASYDVLPARYREVASGYTELVYGIVDQPNRTEVCIDVVNNLLPFLSGHYYVDAMFNDESKQSAEDLISEIQYSMDNLIMQSSWMDVNTINNARDKLSAISNQIGYPDDWPYYSDLFSERYFHITSTNFFANCFGLAKIYQEEDFGMLDSPVDKKMWYSNPAVVNAWYSPNLNQITFPAGILQSPFFSTSNPRAYNYGGMGVVMGHEITHAFDDQGSQYDATGTLNNWWSDESLSNFGDATQCVSECYSSYEIQPGVFVNGDLTLGENIADMGGIREAYDALQRWKVEIKEENEQEEDIIQNTFGMSQDQLFFVSFAQVWCEVTTEEYDVMLTETNSHSPGKFRVEGTLSNYDKFAETFNCPLGSSYNPEKKCRVW